MADKSVVMRRSKVTLRDVAAAAGVSPMSISNFINDRRDLMRPETAERIAAEILRLGYRPQAMGRGLRTAKGFSIGMLIVDDRPTFLADPFITQIVAGLTNALSQHGYGLLLQGVRCQDFADATFLRADRTDGLCVFLSGTDSVRRAMLERLRQLQDPVVAFEEVEALRGPKTCIIRQDNFSGGQEIGRLLLGRGARRFLLLVPATTWPTASRRRAGLEAALDAHPAATTAEAVSCGTGTLKDTQRELGAWIAINGLPDAIVASNDQMGIAAMRWLQSRDVEVPRQVMITGFNGFEFWEYSSPMLTTVRSPAYEMGARGGQEMVKFFGNGRFSSGLITLPVTLQLGGST